MAFAALLALWGITWVLPPLGVALQGLWLFGVMRRSRWVGSSLWLTTLALGGVHVLLEVRNVGFEVIVGLLDFPFALLSVVAAVRLRRDVPWWQTLLLTCPLCSMVLMVALEEAGVAFPHLPWHH